jgi:vitamin B12 transporter
MTCRTCYFVAAIALTGAGHAQVADAVLPELTVYSPRVANQSPTATFAMPVSALRFEPRVDLQSRNFAEGQADVTIRGGIFENTGFSVGATSLFDPQTGHYFAEIPVAPAMLGAPEVMTGADLALRSTNATSGAVAYQWRPIRTAGAASVGGGEFGLTQAEFYQGYSRPTTSSGRRIGADVAWAHSDSDGSVRFGDHVLDRFNARVQLAGRGSQTDLFAGYQDKFFGWPNLYTPLNSNETEDIQTLLLAFNHRNDFAAGDFFEIGAYYRRNEDDYAFNRFAPVGPIHPFQHTTWVKGAAAGARFTSGDFAFNLRAEIIADEITSTSLTFGPYRTRAIAKLAFVPERFWNTRNGAKLRVKAGVTYDDTNRNDATISPLVEIAHEASGASAQRVYVSYSETTQVPTYTALKSNSAAGLFRGNQNLGRQTSRNTEIGVSGHWADWIGRSSFFYREDDDLVDWTFRRGVTARSANEVNVATTGFELVGQRSWRAVDLVLGYTWLTKDADYKGATVDASFYALNYARHRFTAAVVARLSNQFELRMDNEVRFQAANLLRTTGGDDDVFSAIGVTYRPTAWRRLSFTVQVDNLWDSEYQDVPAVPATRRQTSASVRYTW